MIDPVTKGPHTYHTTNPVPFIVCGRGPAAAAPEWRAAGHLADDSRRIGTRAAEGNERPRSPRSLSGVNRAERPMRKPISRLRWYIGGILFLSTVINYIDRQTLSVLAPHIKDEFHWDNSTFALLIIRFPDRVLVRANCIGAIPGRGRHPQRSIHHGGVLLGRRDADVVRHRS